jgi:hypothetical protein
MNRSWPPGRSTSRNSPPWPRLVVDPARHQRGHGHVEGVVVERKVPGRRAQDLGGRAVLAAARSRRRSIGGCGSVSVSDVIAGPKQGRSVPGPAADLEHVTAQPGEHALPEGAQPRPDDSTNACSASRHSYSAGRVWVVLPARLPEVNGA